MWEIDTVTIAAPASCRSGSLTLPFLGSAHAMRWPADHGRDVAIDREAGNATLRLGRWEVHVDVARSGPMSRAAVAMLAGGAMLAALLGGALRRPHSRTLRGHYESPVRGFLRFGSGAVTAQMGTGAVPLH